MKGNDERTVRVPVLGGLVFEVCVGQLWSAIGDEGRISFSVDFGGVTITDGSVNLTAYGEVAHIRVHNAAGTNVIKVTPTLSAVSRTLYPAPGSVITPLDENRDMLTKGRLIHQLTLTYTYTTEEGGIKVLPRSPFSSVLYESPYESQLIMVYDASKVLVTTVDFTPEWITLPTKGTYTLRMQLRHEDLSVLEKWKNTTIQLERQLDGKKDAKTITLAVHETLTSAMGGDSRKLPGDGLRASSNTIYLPLYIVAPGSASQLPGWAKPGDVVLGAVSLVKFDTNEKEKNFDDHGVLTNAPGFYPIQFVVPHKGTPKAPSAGSASSSSASNDASNKGSPTKNGKGAAADSSKPSFILSASSNTAVPQAVLFLLQSSLEHLSGLISSSKFAEWQARSLEFSALLPTLNAELEFKYQTILYYDWLAQQADGDRASALKELATAADNLIKEIDQTALAIYRGTRHPKETAEDKLRHEKLEHYLVTALSRKARTVEKSQVSQLVDEVAKWVDPSTIPMLASLTAPPVEGPKDAQQLRALRKKLPANEIPSKAQYEELISILKALGWNHWVKHYETWNVIRHSLDYELF